MTGKGETNHHVFIKDSIYDHTLDREKTLCYCWQAFRTPDKLKCHIEDCFKINSKKTIKMPKKGEYNNFGRE